MDNDINLKLSGIGFGENLYSLNQTNKTYRKATINSVSVGKVGIYVYASDTKGQTYRFILISYDIGKTSFGYDREVIIDSQLERFLEYKQEEYNEDWKEEK